MSTKDLYNSENLKYYFNQIKKSRLLTAEQEVELAKKIEAGDEIAYNRMVNSNLRLVVKIAKRYMTPEWQLSDLIQEGNIGLMKAVEKFDFRKQVRFSTYASWWIKQTIVRSMSNKRRLIRLPHRKEERLRAINRTITELTQEFNRKPNTTEIAQHLGCKEQDIVSLKSVSENFVSIDAELGNEGCYLVNTLDDSSFAPETVYNKNNLKEMTDQVLDQLQVKEKQILRSRFAFDSRKKETLKEIAVEMKISPETVRQIEMKAIRKIKERHSYLKDYLYC